MVSVGMELRKCRRSGIGRELESSRKLRSSRRLGRHRRLHRIERI
jgi:hypothetical protein